MRPLRGVSVLLVLLLACEPASQDRERPPTSAPPEAAEPDLSFPGGGRILFLPNVGSYTGHFGIVDADGSTVYFGDDRFSYPYWDPANPAQLLTIPFDDSPHGAPRVRAFVLTSNGIRPTGSWRGSPSYTFVSLDGRTIAFTPFLPSGRWSTGRVRVIDRSTGQVTSIRSGTLVPAGWTPDGELIAFPWPGGSLVSWNPASGQVSSSGPSDLWGAVWDPSGRRFAGLAGGSRRHPRTDVVISRLDGRIELRVPAGPRLVETPTWSPNGDRVAFIVRGPDPIGHRNATLHVIDVTSGVDRVVARRISDAFWASWSPDGRWLLVDDWTRERWLFVAADGSERVPYPSLGGFPRWCCPSSPPISVAIPVC